MVGASAAATSSACTTPPPTATSASSDHPPTFDVTRRRNDHLTFGKAGPHFCLGASLARLELRLLLEELAARVGGVELAGPVRRLRSNHINGLKELPLRLS